MNMINIKSIFEESISVKKLCLQQGLECISIMGDEACISIQNGGKIMLCGNGGSAADAQHLAAEMLVRLRPMNNREGVAAIALAQDISTITACGNDFGFDKLYERMVTSLGKKGDCLIGITTSGNSVNIIRALEQCREMQIPTVVFTGMDGGNVKNSANYCIVAPGNLVSTVQELHIILAHALCECVERELFQ